MALGYGLLDKVARMINPDYDKDYSHVTASDQVKRLMQYHGTDILYPTDNPRKNYYMRNGKKIFVDIPPLSQQTWKEDLLGVFDNHPDVTGEDLYFIGHKK